MTAIKENSVLNVGKLKDFKKETIEIHEHNIAYEILNGSENPERTMVLLHGAFVNKSVMKVLASKLVEQRPEDRIILIDMPWHGESTIDLEIEGATVHTYADVLSEVVKEFKGMRKGGNNKW